MNEKYEKVPNIISSKDLDYLSDMFNWNYGAYKNTKNSINSVTDNDLLQLLERAANTFQSTMTQILTILNGGINNE